MPIIALCTPHGSGAIALIRICGEDVDKLVDKISRLSSGKKLIDQQTHTIHHGYVIDNKNKIIDEVLFLLMRGPKTFTGQDTIEISCHNNPFLINQIIKQAIACGAHHAERGEFSKRAFLNKKIDLLQAEAINDLISAQTELSLKKSMEQLQGTLSSHMHGVENELLSLLGLVESSFEFLDEEQHDLDFDNLIKQKLNSLIKTTDELITNFSQQQHIKNGIRIALLGNVNVGKSTLFNALVNKERAIVTEQPGTTRDAIETSVYQDGIFWLYIDTAGLRETSDQIEHKGIERAWQEAANSDIILLVFDVSSGNSSLEDKAFYKKIDEQYRSKIMVIANKSDLSSQITNPLPSHQNFFATSAKEKTGLQNLKQALREKTKKLFQAGDSAYLLNQRQHDLISELNEKLKLLEKNNTDRIQYELVAHHVKQLLMTVSQLTGKNTTEKMIENVFTTFCVGK